MYYENYSSYIPIVKKSKYLNLIIYNPHSEYERKMKDILHSYLKTVPDLTFYFITSRPQYQTIEIDKNEHILYVQGEENYIPAILIKTMKALEYTRELSYDYMIRSNISTVIDWSKFPTSEIKEHGYSSTNIIWFIPDLPFAQGSNIILNRETTHYLIDHEPKLDYTIIDDVAIAQVLPKPYQIQNSIRHHHQNISQCIINIVFHA